MKENKILVSIKCAVYNHEPYLRQCLDGFVMQKTNFRFEAIVHDDASTDGSAAIIREYAEKYPDIIKPIYETENQYSKHDGSVDRIMDAVCKGKYIAICEGDDYWIDPLKLQKQVDMLNSDSSIMMVHTGFMTVKYLDETISWPKYQHFQAISRKEKGIVSLFDKNHIITLTTMFRREVMTSDLLDNAPYIYDYTYFFTAALMGKIKYLPCITGSYRKTPTGAMQSRADEVNRQLYEVYKYFVKCCLQNKPRLSCMERLEAGFFVLTNIIYNGDRETFRLLLSKRPAVMFVLPLSWMYAMAKKIKRQIKRSGK